MKTTHLLLCSALICAATIATLTACAMLDPFKPIITTAGHQILAELDKLLTEYEEAELPIDATPDEYLAFSLEQSALAAKIDNRIYHASLEAPPGAVRPFRKRLHAVPTAGP